jgi:hypothetical protein
MEQEELDVSASQRLQENPDWKWAKEVLDSHIQAILLIETLPKNVTATALEKEIHVRQKAIGLINTWLQEVEGTSKVPEAPKPPDNQMLMRFD